MKDSFEVNRYMVMQFNKDLDSLVQVSPSLGIDNCRKWVKHARECEPDLEFSIVAVLDE